MDKLLFICFIFSSIICFLLLAYPAWAVLRTFFVKKPVDARMDFQQPVSIIIAAYNEEDFIRNKLLFFMEQEEWIPGSEIVVVSSGSTDGTNAILQQFDHLPGIKLVIIGERLTKPQALNMAVAKSTHDILIFSDCRQIIKKGSVQNFLKYFNDVQVGTVNSTISDAKDSGRVSYLRRISNTICLYESKSGSSLNIHGALYAQRRILFRPFPESILHDDLFAVLSTLVQDRRLIQAPDVVIYDIPFDAYYNKSRLERLVRGLMIFILGHWPSMRQLPKAVLVRFLIYKYFKLFMPFVLAGILLPLLYFTQTRGWCLSVVLAILVALVFHAGLRATFFMVWKASFYFSSALFKFFVMNKREPGWEKQMAPKPTFLSPVRRSEP